jgi:hypothetical protein
MVDQVNRSKETIMFKPTPITRPNRLLTVLDQEIGFPNRINSRVTKIKRGYDEKTGEYVFWLEYRTRVKPGILREKSTSKKYPLMHEIKSR